MTREEGRFPHAWLRLRWTTPGSRLCCWYTSIASSRRAPPLGTWFQLNDAHARSLSLSRSLSTPLVGLLASELRRQEPYQSQLKALPNASVNQQPDYSDECSCQDSGVVRVTPMIWRGQSLTCKLQAVSQIHEGCPTVGIQPS